MSLNLIIKIFSVKHKLQVLCPFLYFPTVLRICQVTVGKYENGQRTCNLFLTENVLLNAGITICEFQFVIYIIYKYNIHTYIIYILYII